MIFAVGTYTFERDLFRFVTRIETAQLQTFASEIEDYFAEVQTWDFLRENPRMADLILRQRRSFDENLIILPGKQSRENLKNAIFKPSIDKKELLKARFK